MGREITRRDRDARKAMQSLSVILLYFLADMASGQTRFGPDGQDGQDRQGIFLYGAIDLGLAYQTKGVPSSPYWGQGLEYAISKNENRPQFSVAPNGLGQSHIGARGIEALTEDLDGIFRLESNFNPQSGQIADGARSLVANANVPLASQTANSDSARRGQALTYSFVGLSSKIFGSLTVGRQAAVLRDDIVDYDPQAGAFAFSLIGFSGVTAGGGDTEDNILSNQIKWVENYGPIHAAAAYQPSSGLGFGNAKQFDLGGRYAGFSFDGVFSKVKDAISLAALNTSQTVAAGYPSGSLSGTLSDNTSVTVNGSYRYGPWKGFAGWEHISFANPTHVPSKGLSVNGYQEVFDAGYPILITLPTAKTGAYNLHRLLNVTWTGLSYAATDSLALRAGFYHYDQNNYNFTGSFAATLAAPCSGRGIATSSSKCAGTESAYSLSADYHAAKHVELYAGAMMSRVDGGLASGFLATHTIDPMIGGRYSF